VVAGASWSSVGDVTLVVTCFGFGSGCPAATGGIGEDLALSVAAVASVCCRDVTGAARSGTFARMGTATGGGTVTGADARSAGMSCAGIRLAALR
jgi:hypothetical protein